MSQDPVGPEVHKRGTKAREWGRVTCPSPMAKSLIRRFCFPLLEFVAIFTFFLITSIHACWVYFCLLGLIINNDLPCVLV